MGWVFSRKARTPRSPAADRHGGHRYRRTVLAFLGGEVGQICSTRRSCTIRREVIAVGEPFGAPQPRSPAEPAADHQPKLEPPGSDAVLTSVDDEPVQLVAVPAERDCNTACNRRSSYRRDQQARQINGLTPRTTTRKLIHARYECGRSGIWHGHILACRTDGPPGWVVVLLLTC